MKVTFIGTGTMGSITRLNTSVLVDDILFDIGTGTVKQIEKLKVYTKNIKNIVITHFHADHILDIPNFIIGRGIRKETDNVLNIIGPIGIREFVLKIMCLTHSDGDIHKYDNIEEKYNIRFYELDNMAEYIGDNFRIQALELKHGTASPINGYILHKDNIKIGYACDTTLCNNYYKICEIVDYLFSDVTGINTNEAHIGLEDYIKIAEKYNRVKCYAVHRGDYEILKDTKIYFPMDGNVLEI
ncbi:MAG: MBL fold metallo-hydrolase [Clostridia bacterium]|nr:MBL fold metallo-hydrolase [Clostridia bacterium]